MSQIEDAIYEQMKADGTADWINQTVAEATGEPAATTEAPDEGTDEVDEVEEVDDSTEEEVPADAETDPEAESEGTDEAEASAEDEGLFIDMTPETEAFLAKYDGDLNAALQGAANLTSKFGEQGNELGDLRKELAQYRAEVQAQVNQPVIEWPDEDAEPEEAVLAYRQIAEQATSTQDESTLGSAIMAWHEIDPLGAEAWATMKYTQMMIEESRATGDAPGVSLEDGVADLAKKYPLATPEFQAEVGKEMERFPTLQRTFQDMNAPPKERLAALEEAARLVASRQTDGDVRQAVRRVAVTQSEEARKARAEARVATGGGRGKPVAPEDRQIKVGTTGQTVGANELQSQIKALTGMDIQIG
jgi:hypothetical protein